MRSLTFLGSFVEGAVFLNALIDINDLCTSKELHNHTGSDDRANTEFHQSTSVGGEDDSHPVERIVS